MHPKTGANFGVVCGKQSGGDGAISRSDVVERPSFLSDLPQGVGAHAAGHSCTYQKHTLDVCACAGTYTETV